MGVVGTLLALGPMNGVTAEPDPIIGEKPALRRHWEQGEIEIRYQALMESVHSEETPSILGQPVSEGMDVHSLPHRSTRGSTYDAINGNQPGQANSDPNPRDREEFLNDLLRHGRDVFTARFNILDGQGRPGSTGTGAPRVPDQPAFIRTSAPESNSCAGCHNQPFVGGAGDIALNVFVLAQALDPVTFSVSPEFSNERNTLGMFGAGPIEMLAREMTAELVGIRREASERARIGGVPVTLPLVSKGVGFGDVTVMPDGKIDPSGIEGVDWDLIVKPFHQKGAVVSIREFTNNAMNHHHGMQTTERFGVGTDPDQDGITNELTVGDMTAVTLFQALLPTPIQVEPKHPVLRQAVERGRTTFGEVGCTECHIPSLHLESPFYTEPNPYNPPGNLRLEDVSTTLAVDLSKDGMGQRLESDAGGVIVEAFTDLKRHNLCDDELMFFCNEQLHQGSLVGFADPAEFTVPAEPRPTEEFLTRKLWDVGNSDPYGHRGDLTTISEAIYWHGGEARASRDAFMELPQASRDDVIEFLKSLLVMTGPEARLLP